MWDTLCKLNLFTHVLAELGLVGDSNAHRAYLRGLSLTLNTALMWRCELAKKYAGKILVQHNFLVI